MALIQETDTIPMKVIRQELEDLDQQQKKAFKKAEEQNSRIRKIDKSVRSRNRVQQKVFDTL